MVLEPKVGRSSTNSSRSAKSLLIISIFDWLLCCSCLRSSKDSNIFDTTPSYLLFSKMGVAYCAILWVFMNYGTELFKCLFLIVVWNTPTCNANYYSYLLRMWWIFLWNFSQVALKIRYSLEFQLESFSYSAISLNLSFFISSQCSSIPSFKYL